jgi:hypothetical protein
MTPLFLFLFGLMPQRGGTVAGSNPGQANAAITCFSELRWINGNQKFYSLNSPITLSFFSAVGSGCTPAEMRVSAIFLDVDENVICSGVVENIAQVDQNTQTTILEFKPLILLEFVRWRNTLRGGAQPAPRRLACIGPEQLTEVSRNETDRANSLRIDVTVLTRSGGMSNLEIRIDPHQVRF